MTSSVPILRTLLIFLCALALSKPLGASTILFQTDSQLIALSERVVHARVVAQRTTRESPSGHRIFTVTTLAILEDFTGREGDTVDVWELGGTLDGQTLFVGGQVRYAIGEEVLVCLDRGSHGLRSIAMGFSKFSVVRTATAPAQLRRGIDANTSIVGGVVPAQERSLDDFRALAATVLLTPSRVVARAIPDGPATVSQPWTKIVGEPGWRWLDADQKVPVLVYKKCERAVSAIGRRRCSGNRNGARSVDEPDDGVDHPAVRGNCARDECGRRLEYDSRAQHPDYVRGP